ncbi:MAG: hypothetical protein QHH30_00420 [candidate division NC10 bacterium]|nr:hypothetical protein [candidate division NC10 bacterium]
MHKEEGAAKVIHGGTSEEIAKRLESLSAKTKRPHGIDRKMVVGIMERAKSYLCQDPMALGKPLK